MVNPLIGNKDLRNDKNVKFSDASYLLYYGKNASIFFNTFLFWVMPYVKYLLWQYSICHQNQNVFRKKEIVLIFLMIPDISSTGLKQNHESSNQFMVEWPKKMGENIFLCVWPCCKTALHFTHTYLECLMD